MLDEGGRRPLLFASAGVRHFKDHFIHQRLLEHGADINVQDQFGHTPLHWASFNGVLRVVHQLLDRAADVEVKNDEGKTVSQDEADRGYDEVVELLRELGGK